MEQAYRSSSAEAALVSKLASQKSNRLLKNIGSFFTRFKEVKSIFKLDSILNILNEPMSLYGINNQLNNKEKDIEKY